MDDWLTITKIAISEKEQMAALLLGLNKILYLIDRCRIYEILYIQQPHPTDPVGALATQNLTSALKQLYAIILQFLAKANNILEKGTAHRSLSAFLKPADVLDLEKKCNSSEERAEIEAGNCERYYRQHAQSEEFDKLTTLLQDLDTQNKLLYGVQSTVDDLQNRAKNNEQAEILTWASNIPFKKIHNSAKEGRTLNTGEWLLQHYEFKKWRETDESKILWLHGIRKHQAISVF